MTVRFAHAIAIWLATPLIAGAILFAGVDRLEAQNQPCHYGGSTSTGKCPKVRDHRQKPIIRDHRTDKPARQEGRGRRR
jgi:hypothetical protein